MIDPRARRRTLCPYTVLVIAISSAAGASAQDIVASGHSFLAMSPMDTGEPVSIAFKLSPRAVRPRKDPFTDASVGVGSRLTPSGSYYGTLLGTTQSANVLIGVRRQYTPLLGLRANLGFSHLSETYRDSSSAILHSIPANVYEYSGSFVVQQPGTARQLSLFAELGGGVLNYRPTIAPFSGHNSYRAALLFGAGADYRLAKGFALRGEYRGLYYKTPDFAGTPAFQFNTGKAFTITSEPTISLTYRLTRSLRAR